MNKPSVLIIDDTPSNLHLLSNLLSDKYTVKVAKSGFKGIQLAMADTPPQLILLDVLMPEPNGFDVCKVLKRNRKTRHIPIVFLTNLGGDEPKKAGLLLGAVDYMVKPVRSHDLMSKVAKHLEGNRE